ncbi:MAG: phospholipase D family protein, partial [Gemmatimonadales bacterium]
SLTDEGAGHILISRRDELDTLSAETRAQFKDIHILRAQPESGEESAADAASSEVVAANDLHAKLFIADRGWNATVWTGSANATSAAFNGNVEFLVELTGKKSKVGIDAFLEKLAGGVGMMDLLEPYVPTEHPAVDAAAEAMDDLLDRLRTAIARDAWTISITAAEGVERYTVVASSDSAMPSLPEGVTAQCRLLSLGDETFRSLVSGESAGVTFDGVSLEGLTAFLAFQLVGRAGATTRRAEFVVSARLLGEPPNRRDRILQGMLRDKRAVVRFLLMLLAESGEEGEIGLGGAGAHASGRSMASDESESLLEPLLRTFAREPGRLTAVANLVRDLEATDDGRSLVPDGLAELIEVLQSARGEVTQ